MFVSASAYSFWRCLYGHKLGADYCWSAVEALLRGFIDYAGMYPPAKLSVAQAASRFAAYSTGTNAWMLNRFVVGKAELDQVPGLFEGKLAVVGDTDTARACSLETRGPISSKKPVYCEVSPNHLDELDAVKKSGCFAKVRTGGLVPSAIPSPADVANFIVACAERRLAFKATAGLHHPIRGGYALTYEPDSEKGTMHGFLNLLVAAVFAWKGDRDIEPIIAETDPSAFRFDCRVHWRMHSVGLEQILDARENFIHSIGSCSFEEPVYELEMLGILS